MSVTVTPVAVSGPLSSSADFDTDATLRIGNKHPNTPTFGGPFNGQIDEVEIFKRALTENEVFEIWAAGSAGKCRSYADLSIDKQWDPTTLSSSDLVYKIIVTNTININVEGLADKLEVISVAKVFAASIERINTGRSLSSLFSLEN